MLDQKRNRRTFASHRPAPNRRHGKRSLSRRGRASSIRLSSVLVGVLASVLVLAVGFALLQPAFDVEPGSDDSGRADPVAGLPASSPAESNAGRAPEPVYSRLPIGKGNAVYSYADEPGGHRSSGVAFESSTSDPSARPRLVEIVPAPLDRPDLKGPLRIEYSLDSELTQKIFQVLRAGRVERGHVIVLDPETGRVLAYVSTDPEGFPPTRAYPAASLVKVVTAAALLETAGGRARRPCRYRGNPYRLTRSRIQRPSSGREISLEVALATSNNQCFAQFAVNDVGSLGMLDALDQFGWLSQAGPGHDAGSVEVGRSDFDLGRLGCGLAGCRITPLHAARLAATLATGTDIEPWWVDRVIDAEGVELVAPSSSPPRRVIGRTQADQLRHMMVRTTTRGTARSAFRDRRGRPRLGSVQVAGKTGNLSGSHPAGRYEWFVGAAPAEAPSIAIAVVQVHGNLWWKKSSEIAADVLSRIFCKRGHCEPALANRFTGKLDSRAAPIFLSESGHAGE